MREFDHKHRKQLMERTLSYLGDPKQEGAFALSDEIEACVEELSEEARFIGCYERFELTFDAEGYPVIEEADLTLKSNDLRSLFAGCDRAVVIATTLGVAYERYSKRIQSGNMSHGVVLDAAASAYLEEKTDIFEEELELGPHTFRFAPGYGDLDLGVNAVLVRAMKADKRIGISVGPSGLFLPQKSMLGLVGVYREGAAGAAAGAAGASGDAGSSYVNQPCKTCARRESCAQKPGSAKCFGPTG